MILVSMSLSQGTRLGPYEIGAPVGAGGMGEVYQARDTRLNRTVAIKILPRHLSEKPEAIERFEREARAISGLNHPNVCQLYDVGEQDGTRFLVMEFTVGETQAEQHHVDQIRRENFGFWTGQSAGRGTGTHFGIDRDNIQPGREPKRGITFGCVDGAWNDCGHGAVHVSRASRGQAGG